MRNTLFHRLIQMRFCEKKKSHGHGLELAIMFLLLDSDSKHTQKRREISADVGNTEPLSRDGSSSKSCCHKVP